MESSQLPPCRECLFMYVLRANYQATIWRRALQIQPFIPGPDNNGWIMDDDGQLVGCPLVANTSSTRCGFGNLSLQVPTIYKLPNCTCLSNELKCTDLCKLQTCSNQKLHECEGASVDLDDTDSSDAECDIFLA